MRVALFSRNARCADAIGSQVAAKIAYFRQLGAEVRLFLSDGQCLRAEAAELRPIVANSRQIWASPEEREYLLTSDFVIAEYGAAYDLMHLLPALAGQGPRLFVDYRGVTPVELADTGLRSELEEAARQRVLLWCADAVVVQSQFAAHELQTQINLPRHKIHEIPCWIDPVRSCPSSIANDLRQKYGLTDARVILFVGRLAGNKQPEMIIKALPQLAVNVHAVFVGSHGDKYQERLLACQKLVTEMQLMNRVHFTNTVSEVELEGWYRSADLLCLPSKHECFGMPVIEAMQRGLPVVCSDTGSLPEVMGHAGLCADVADVREFAQQMNRCLEEKSLPRMKKIAFVTHRFGTQFAGGAEKSLRLMMQALQSQGYEIEVFTTCNVHESRWANTLTAGTCTEDGFIVHRFEIDNYDAEQLDRAYEEINRAEGIVSIDIENQYLTNSLGSSSLIDALMQRRDEFAAILTGPYLFKLTFEVSRSFGEQVLLVPCFHQEPLARLQCFRQLYRQIGGLIFHTETESRLASHHLRIQHPRNTVAGTILAPTCFTGNADLGRERIGDESYLVYVGRYCPEKGLEQLFDYMDALNQGISQQIKLVCMGQGPMPLPKRPWLVNLGFVQEKIKRDVIAGAFALVNLSRNESLSIVALEAWALGIPVLVDAGCDVLVEQANRSKAGAIVATSADFAQVIHNWLNDPLSARTMGMKGKVFVKSNYASETAYAQRLTAIVESLQQPLAKIMSNQGIRRADLFSTLAWQHRMSVCLDNLAQHCTVDRSLLVDIDPLQGSLSFETGTTSGTIMMRLRNRGNIVLDNEGPAKMMLSLSISSKQKKRLARTMVHLPNPLAPGQEQLIVAAIDLPKRVGLFRLRTCLIQNGQVLKSHNIPLQIMTTNPVTESVKTQLLGPLINSARSTLAQAKRMEKLPDDYLDVSEGKLASLKRSLKRKLLNNFRKAYVDVAFRQQSALNEKLIAVMNLLLETVSANDAAQSLAEMQRQLRKLERAFKKQQRVNQRLRLQLKTISSPDESLMEGT